MGECERSPSQGSSACAPVFETNGGTSSEEEKRETKVTLLKSVCLDYAQSCPG